MSGMNSTKSREVIYGGRIIGAKIRAADAREAAEMAIREADRAAAELWSIQMEAYGYLPANQRCSIGGTIEGESTSSSRSLLKRASMLAGSSDWSLDMISRRRSPISVHMARLWTWSI